MGIVRQYSKNSEAVKKEGALQLADSLASHENRNQFKSNIEKEFIDILKMKHEMELVYMKSLERIQRICQEKVEKYSHSIYHSASSNLVFTLIRAYGVSLKQRYQSLNEYVEFVPKFIRYLTRGLEAISVYSNEKTKEGIHQLHKQISTEKVTCFESGKKYHQAFTEYQEILERFNSKKSKWGSKCSSRQMQKLQKMEQKLAIMKENLNIERFSYLKNYEISRNLADVLQSEQQIEILYGEKLFYDPFLKSLFEAYFKKEDDYLLKSRYCASGCLTEIVTMEHDWSPCFSESPQFKYEYSSKFSSLLHPNDKIENLFGESSDVITKDIVLKDMIHLNKNILERRKNEIEKLTDEIEKWIDYCKVFATKPIANWPSNTTEFIQNSLFYNELKIYYQLTQSYIKRKTYEYLIECVNQKKVVMDISNHVLPNKSGLMEFDLNTCEKDDEGIPIILRKCFDFVLMYGLKYKGIFRISVVSKSLTSLNKTLENGDPIPLDTNIHTVAALLKNYVRNIENFVDSDSKKILTSSTSDFRNMPTHKAERLCARFMLSLNDNSRNVMFYILRVIEKMTHSAEQTLMTSFNLAVVFQPNVFKIENESDVQYVSTLNDIFTFMIDHVEEIYQLCLNFNSNSSEDDQDQKKIHHKNASTLPNKTITSIPSNSDSK